ncbi:MAG: sugar transferase [Thermodesulfobacteriota bacterium]
MLKFFNTYFPIRAMIFFLGEGALIIAGILIAANILPHESEIDSARADMWLRIVVIAFILQINLYYMGLYDFSAPRRIMDMGLRLLQAIGVTCLVLALIYTLFPQVILEEQIFFVGLILLVLFLVSWRFLYQVLCQKRIWNEPFFIIGTGPLAEMISDHIQCNLDVGFVLAGVFTPTGVPQWARALNVPAYDTMDDLCAVASQKGVNKVVVALEERREASPVDALLQCRMQGVEIYEGVQFFELLSGRIVATQTPPSWLIFTNGFNRHRVILGAKRVLDVCAAGVGLLLAGPLMVALAALVKLFPPGPVFFRQVRVGQWSSSFEVIKFRTMREDAEQQSGAVWASESDPRITRLGRVMRKFRLDELPQFFNVLKGEMSFVGPRPERPVFVEQLNKRLPYYGERHTVKPGITGWAQVNYGYGASEEDALRKLEYDLFYIKHLSLLFDLFIVLKTIKTVLFSNEGAR